MGLPASRPGGQDRLEGDGTVVEGIHAHIELARLRLQLGMGMTMQVDPA